MKECCLVACALRLVQSYRPEPSCLGWHYPQRAGLSPLITNQSLQKTLYRLAFRQILRRHFLNQGSFLSGDSGPCHIDIKQPITSSLSDISKWQITVSRQEQALVSQRTRVSPLALMLGNSQLPVSPTLGNLTPSVGTCTFSCIPIHIIKNKMNVSKSNFK